MVVLLCELNLAHVEVANAMNLIMLVNHGRGFALGFGQRQVNEVLKEQKGNSVLGSQADCFSALWLLVY